MAFAPGIPEKSRIEPIPVVSRPRRIRFSIQRHLAERAGPHFDLRLAINNAAHSWAIRHWPRIYGKRYLAVQQPTHTVRYMTWSGTIKEGYGKGTVTVWRSGDAEVLEANDRKIVFVLYDKDPPEEYVLIRTSGKNWIIFKRKIDPPPTKKPKFKTLSQDKVPQAPEMFDALSAKLDGAHAAIVFGKPGSPVRVFSPRISKRTGKPIQYTYKMPDVLRLRTPPELANTVVRGEVLAVKARKSMGHTATARILNTKDPFEARRKQRQYGKLKIYPFGVDIYRGRDVRNLPPNEQLQLLREVSKATGWKPPQIETSPSRKKELFEKIRSGQHPMTDEGLIGFNLNQAGKPVKIKFRPDADVWVRRIFPSKRPGYAGGFEYSYTWNSPIVGRVGTGFDHATLRDMYEHPEKYIGRKATITFQRGGKRALRAPSFVRWHLDY